jgi:hypothetical protein
MSCSVCVDSPFYRAVFERYNVSHRGLQKFCYFSQTNINALNLAGAIDKSVGTSDGLLSAHATVSMKPE